MVVNQYIVFFFPCVFTSTVTIPYSSAISFVLLEEQAGSKSHVIVENDVSASYCSGVELGTRNIF